MRVLLFGTGYQCYGHDGSAIRYWAQDAGSTSVTSPTLLNLHWALLRELGGHLLSGSVLCVTNAHCYHKPFHGLPSSVHGTIGSSYPWNNWWNMGKYLSGFVHCDTKAQSPTAVTTLKLIHMLPSSVHGMIGSSYLWNEWWNSEN